MAVEPKDITPEEYNSRLKEWGSDVTGKLRSSIRMLSSKGKGDLVKSLRMKTHQDLGEIDSIGYSFKHYGVFFHKGVGRGYHMEAGTVIRGSKILSKGSLDINTKLRQVILRSAAVKRKPKPWLNPIIDDNIERLANMVAEMRADQAVNATRIYIQ